MTERGQAHDYENLDFKYGAQELKDSQVLMDLISRIAEKLRGSFKHSRGGLGKKFTFVLTATSDHHAISTPHMESIVSLENKLNKSFD